MKTLFQHLKVKTVVGLSIVIGCSYKNMDDHSFNKENVSKEIQAMLENYHRDIKDSGLTAEFKYLDSSHDFFWVPPGYSTALPYDSVRTILENNSKMFTAIEFRWNTLQIFPLSDEIASYTGIVGGAMTDTTGTESSTQIIESGVVIKRSDGWKLLCGQSAALNTSP